MPRDFRAPQDNSFFRGAEAHRLLSMVVMVAILYAIIGRARDPKTWEIFTKRDAAPVVRVGEEKAPRASLRQRAAELKQAGLRKTAAAASAPVEGPEPAEQIRTYSTKQGPVADLLALGKSEADEASEDTAQAKSAPEPAGDSKKSSESKEISDPKSSGEPKDNRELPSEPAPEKPVTAEVEKSERAKGEPAESEPAKSEQPASKQEKSEGQSEKAEPAKGEAPVVDTLGIGSAPKPVDSETADPAKTDAAGGDTEKPANNGNPKPSGDPLRPNLPAEPEVFNDISNLPEREDYIPEDDPLEVDAFAVEMLAIHDRAVTIERQEMPLYKRFFRWVKSQKPESLTKRARTDVLYTELMQAPEDYRGAVIHLNLQVRRGMWHPVKREELGGDYVYEFWGFSRESQGRMFVVLTVDPPKGMPVSPEMNEEISFDGYFFKLQGYQPGAAKPGAKDEAAPLLIGRLKWLEKPPAVAADTDYALYLIVGGTIVIAAVIRIALMLRPKRPRVQLSRLPRDEDGELGEKVDIDTWLTRAEDGVVDGGGNNSENADESYGSESSDEASRSRRRGVAGESISGRILSDDPLISDGVKSRDVGGTH